MAGMDAAVMCGAKGIRTPDLRIANVSGVCPGPSAALETFPPLRLLIMGRVRRGCAARGSRRPDNQPITQRWSGSSVPKAAGGHGAKRSALDAGRR
jgi:hypothetical protein